MTGEERKADHARRKSLAMSSFKRIAKESGFPVYCGQIQNNRVYLDANHPRNYFEFGDVRVDRPDRNIVVEIDDGSPVTNLVKYWYSLEHEKFSKPIALLHVFVPKTEDDYWSHYALWAFVRDHMTFGTSDRLQATEYSYWTDDQLHRALEDFRRLIAEG